LSSPMPVPSLSSISRSVLPETVGPQLGLVCITTSQAVRYKTLTRKRLLLMEQAEQIASLRSLYTENLRRFNLAIDFCEEQNIRLYRLPSNLFPFVDTALGQEILEEFASALRQAGDRAQAIGLRLVLHPEQFVVLNSDNPTVIENSITVLSALAHSFDLMGQPHSPWTAMNIHGGKGDRAERLIQVIRDLPDPTRTRLTLENDEHMYGAETIAAICQAAGVAMVFDAHHHLVRERLDSYDDPSVAGAIALARSTWPDPTWQLVHISNGRDTLHDPSHSDLIWQMPEAFRQVPWIEVEAKHKETAIARLRETWLKPGEV